jgi:hypothetical protein
MSPNRNRFRIHAIRPPMSATKPSSLRFLTFTTMAASVNEGLYQFGIYVGGREGTADIT